MATVEVRSVEPFLVQGSSLFEILGGLRSADWRHHDDICVEHREVGVLVEPSHVSIPHQANVKRRHKSWPRRVLGQELPEAFVAHHRQGKHHRELRVGMPVS